MGRSKNDIVLQDFTSESLANRDLIISMLKYEDQLFMGPGQELYRNSCYLPDSSIEPSLTIQRKVLNDFGFTNDPASLGNYRKIVQIYWRGPDDYDEEVLQSVVYLRANKLLRYRTPILENGSLAKDCRLLNLDGSESRLSEHWKIDLNNNEIVNDNLNENLNENDDGENLNDNEDDNYNVNDNENNVNSKQRILVCAFSGS